ncbi:MAG: PAS domain-containing protein [Deltaproteobacteria bacterium]|nr:PAS domain-containing protein [Deltaproteobacteria bacterium]
MAQLRVRLVVLAAVIAVAMVIAVRLTELDRDQLSIVAGMVGFLLVIATGWIVHAWLRRPLEELTSSVQDVVRDTSRRVPALQSAGASERQLADWVNFLADDAERAHRSLARERELLATVADGMTQGVIAIDDDHKIELLNDAARKMLGVTSSPVGEPLIEFVRVPEVFGLIEDARAASAEVELLGGVKTLIRVAHKYGGPGRVLLLEDVTAMRRLESVRRDFVANVSHELRTPVSVIRANAETLLAGAKDDPVMAPKLIDGLHRNAERLARILTDLLDLSRLEAGQYRLELTPVPVGALAEQSMTAVEPQAAKRNVKVSITVSDELVVKADAKALDQILVNLIDNGVKYTRPDGNVWIEARPDADGAIRIEVRDDGPGIAAKHRERVFERFYRADPSRSREAGGTGLGLSIVKHLVESMDGEVGVEPNAPTGSIFWLRLPKGES